MRPPTERHRAMAAQRRLGKTYQTIARDFKTTTTSAQRSVEQVERYDLGMRILKENPASLEGLGLIGRVRPLLYAVLQARGYRTLHDLDGTSLADLVRLPGVGRLSARLLFKLALEVRQRLGVESIGQ